MRFLLCGAMAVAAVVGGEGRCDNGIRWGAIDNLSGHRSIVVQFVSMKQVAGQPLARVPACKFRTMVY
jgi:hypothetical protein